MDLLAQMLDRVRLGGTLLFHFELGHPWNLALPARPYALFHYLSRGSATLVLEQGQGQKLSLTKGDFVVVTRGEPHLIYSDRRTTPPQEWPTRTVLPSCFASACLVASTSAAREVSGFSTSVTL